jgi:arylsulfatase A-like enzyme
MKAKNIVIISLDEVRNDNLSCNGYTKMETTNIDRIAREGIVFEKAISAGCMTPICMSSFLCAQYPNKHTMRLPLCKIQSKTTAQILQENGYTTCFITGNGLVGSKHGFDIGFSDFFEPTSTDVSWDTWSPTGKDDDMFYEGWWWVDDYLDWIRQNHKKSPFFIWGHLYETHEGAEAALLRDGRIKEGVLSEMRYKDARIKVADEQLIGGLIALFDELQLWDDTLLILMSDHGTGVGEHPVKPIPHRSGGLLYPQHRSMYDHDTNIFLIIRDKDLPSGVRIPGVVRSIDVMPTVLDYVGIPIQNEWNFDGLSLLPMIEKGKAEGLQAYSEDLYEYRSDYADVEPNLLVGSLQAIRTDEAKLIRNLSSGREEFYDMLKDPGEQNNLIDQVKERDDVVELRRILNSKLLDSREMLYPFSKDEEEAIKNRLRRLGYLV